MGNPKYTHCTIDSIAGRFQAKVTYSDISKAWGPSEVLVDGEWIGIDQFDDMPEYNRFLIFEI